MDVVHDRVEHGQAAVLTRARQFNHVDHLPRWHGLVEHELALAVVVPGPIRGGGPGPIHDHAVNNAVPLGFAQLARCLDLGAFDPLDRWSAIFLGELNEMVPPHSPEKWPTSD